MRDIGKNPTLITVLKEGGRVIFPNNFALRGIPEDNFIEVCTWNEDECDFKHDTMEELTTFGLSRAMEAKDRYDEFLADD